MSSLPCCTGTEGQRNLVVVVWGNGGGKGKSVQVEGDSLRERRYKEAGLLFSQGRQLLLFLLLQLWVLSCHHGFP